MFLKLYVFFTASTSSENTNIAKVSQSGTVSAVGPGQTNIVVRTSNGKVARCKVVIQAPLQSISLSEKDFTMTKALSDRAAGKSGKR